MEEEGCDGEYGAESVGAESQDMPVEEIICGFATDVASRGPPRPDKVERETVASSSPRSPCLRSP